MKLYKFILLIVSLSYAALSAKMLSIDIDKLSKNISKYKIIDTRSSKLYFKGHIAGALNLPINITYENRNKNGKIVQPAKFQKIARKLGLNINDNIIVYDSGIFYDSTRLFWTLEVYGFKNVKLLNGGYKQWLQHGLQQSKFLPKTKKTI